VHRDIAAGLKVDDRLAAIVGAVGDVLLRLAERPALGLEGSAKITRVDQWMRLHVRYTGQLSFQSRTQSSTADISSLVERSAGTGTPRSGGALSFPRSVSSVMFTLLLASLYCEHWSMTP